MLYKSNDACSFRNVSEEDAIVDYQVLKAENRRLKQTIDGLTKELETERTLRTKLQTELNEFKGNSGARSKEQIDSVAAKTLD